MTYLPVGRYNERVAITKEHLLNEAISLLRDGTPLTIDALAKRVGLTKPGVIHHFPSKEALMVALIEQVTDSWEEQIRPMLVGESTPANRLRAYVHSALSGDFDGGDLVLLADMRLRDRLCALWSERLAPWFGADISATSVQRAALQSARLIADGAWFDQGLGIVTMTDDERAAVREVALRLVDEGTAA